MNEQQKKVFRRIIILLNHSTDCSTKAMRVTKQILESDVESES